MDMATDKKAAPLGKRLLWFAGLWLASVTVLGIVAYGIRAVLL